MSSYKEHECYFFVETEFHGINIRHCALQKPHVVFRQTEYGVSAMAYEEPCEGCTRFVSRSQADKIVRRFAEL